jgi:serine/threonine protein kinase
MIHDADAVNDLDQIRSRYHLLRQLGRDGSFPLYAVRARDSDRHYLLKVIEEPGSRRTRAGALQPWQAHTVKELQHPKLMVMHAVHHLQGGAVALAMDRRRGRTLAELLDAEGRLSISRTEHILRDIGEALAYLHTRGVVHRGVSPHSIFLDHDRGHARLSFFGIDREPDHQGRDGEIASLIRAFTYLAPEQISGLEQVEGRRLSLRSDLFSLGLVGFAMLTGRHPWRGASLEDLLKGRKLEPLAALEEIRPDAPTYLREAIERCLERNARRRCRSASEFLAHLDAVDQDTAQPPAPDSISIRMRIEAGLSAVPAVFGRRFDGAAGRKLAMVTAAIVIGLLTFGAIRAEDDSVARSEEEVPSRATAVLELPPPEQIPAGSERDAGVADAAGTSPAGWNRGTSPESTGVAAPLRPPDAPPTRARSLPRFGPGQNFASSDRLVLLGEPLAPGDTPR